MSRDFIEITPDNQKTLFNNLKERERRMALEMKNDEFNYGHSTSYYEEF